MCVLLQPSDVDDLSDDDIEDLWWYPPHFERTHEPFGAQHVRRASTNTLIKAHPPNKRISFRSCASLARRKMCDPIARACRSATGNSVVLCRAFQSLLRGEGGNAIASSLGPGARGPSRFARAPLFTRSGTRRRSCSSLVACPSRCGPHRCTATAMISLL